MILLAAALAALPQPKSWPLPNGLGGILGDFFMAGAHVHRPCLPDAAASFVAGLLFLIAGTCSCSSPAAPTPPRSSRSGRRAATLPSEWANASLGAAMHVAMHTGATIKRGFWWRKAGDGAEEEPELEIAAPAEDAEPDPDGRIEPTFDLEPYEYDDEDRGGGRRGRRRHRAQLSHHPRNRGEEKAYRPPRAAERHALRGPAAQAACSSSRARAREPPSATKCCRRMRASSKACSRISASRARSPMCAPAPWSRCTSSSPRPAPNPRA